MRSVFAAALLALLAWQTPTRASSLDTPVQTLANVPALARLAAHGDRAIEAHLRKLGRIYSSAGYPRTAAAIRKSRAAVSIFASQQPDLRSARKALRTLAHSITAENFYQTPATVGERLPNYRDLAMVFHRNAVAVLKNVRHGQPPTHKLGGRKGTLWLTQTADGTVLPGGSYGSVGGVVTIGGGGWSLPKVAIFPPDIDLPPVADFTLRGTLEEPDLVDGVEFPAGSRIVSVAADFVLPQGAALWSDSGALLPGGSTLALMSGLRVAGQPGTRWIAYPPETTLPNNPIRITWTVGFPCEANGITLPTGSIIRERHVSYEVPEGAIDLGGPDLEITQIDGQLLVTEIR